MLDTNFPRILGDAGNPASYAMPVRIRIVQGAGSLDIVQDGRPTDHLITAFCNAAKELETEGACAIISTCGFLITVQEQISSAVDIPVMVSALSLYTELCKRHHGRGVAILTASRTNLGQTALNAAGIQSQNISIAGMEDCPPFANAILQSKENQTTDIDTVSIEKAVIARAAALLKHDPTIGAFLLECTNLPPYAKAITAATGRPVYSIFDGVDLLIGNQI
jgi:hypothetical protein